MPRPLRYLFHPRPPFESAKVSNHRGFVLIDVLMEGVAVMAVAAMTAIGTVQVSRALASVKEARAQARYEVLRRDLQELRARQVLHYADKLTYAESSQELRFEPSPGVFVEIVATGRGWAAAATHARLDDGAGCALYTGDIEPPRQPAAPPTPGEIVCTD